MITADTEVHTNDIFLRKAIYIVHKGKCFYSGRDVSLDELKVIRQPVLNQTRNKMYFKVDELDIIKKYYIDKYGVA